MNLECSRNEWKPVHPEPRDQKGEIVETVETKSQTDHIAPEGVKAVSDGTSLVAGG